MDDTDEKVIADFARKGALTFISWVALPGMNCAYLIALSMGLNSEEGLWATTRIAPALIFFFGTIYPYAALRLLAARALRHRPDDAPGERLGRILRLPWQSTVFTTYAAWTLGGLCFSIPVCLQFDKEALRVVLGSTVAFCFGVVMSVPIALSLEKQLVPLAMAEQRLHPAVAPRGGGFFWPRQAWFLPFTFVASIVSTLLLSGCVMAVKMLGLRDVLRAELATQGTLTTSQILDALGGSLVTELLSSMAWVAGLVLILPAITTYMLARRQAEGTRAVGVAIEALADGHTTSPEWVSTDEIGTLASGMNAVLAKLRQLPLTLQASAAQLSEAGSHLRAANDEQQQSLTRQAAALHEAQVTSEEIKRTSLVAAERADAVLQVAIRAEEWGQKGETAVEQSVTGLADIRRAVDGIQQRLARLAESTTQIGDITETVKDLADQSHLLAVNAAIEAARSGEQGKGFAVVAREIRGLADQSIQSTRRIRGILQEISQGIRDAALMGEQGVRTIGTGLDQMRASGESLRELSRISQENSTAARQIAAAVTQQNAGFSQIFTAIGDLSQIMDATLRRLESTQEATAALSHVSQEVGRMAGQFTATS
ncbi:methyl-accepting chemotaxis protein [Pyxidicoccus parkwayensis]|uniref:Methyl-accepting chemotaxis protein n=1 Tax=Pyxidicoccus parkwayensis TaxID=2813578 RepID=A0ABX7NRA7_9BACT|nr:methyl-accepting chemotaxis protein [Pyxidicoccus parkwaysis]QSQ19984.1 methyl-accepting chemotaxis protein [Pyxidicoccus parkwaysis]